MKFFQLLINRSKSAIPFVIVLGIFCSLLNSGLLYFINNAISNRPLPIFPEYDWLVFIIIIATSLICSKLFQTYMIKLTNNILFDFEIEILNKLKHSSYEDFEELGNEKVYTAINDTKVLAYVPEVFMNAFNSAIIVICCLGYLFWISPVGAVSVLAVMIALLIFYLVRNRSIEKDLNKQRDLQNTYYKYLDDMLHGFKELKMSIVRNNSIFSNYLVKNRVEGRDITISSSIRYLDNELTGSYSWYIVLGVTMFVLPTAFGLTVEKTAGFLITILYLIGPVAVLITLIPTYTRVKIALQRLNLFEEIVGTIGSNVDKQLKPLAETEFDNIRFEDVTFRYHNSESNQTFVMEPINTQINKGELIFITGGNGSGKSTFGYLLTGLYRPFSGKIYLNDEEITPDNYCFYSDKISAVFTNNHLFSENYDGFNLRNTNQHLMEYIELMDMGKALRLDDEKNRMTKGLSKGQQKRLAMILALMEKKQILLLDEWAAEQDPRFRAYFYKEVIKRLLKEGKTIIAITHDDDFYSIATRIIKFNYGKIVSDTYNESTLLKEKEAVSA